MRRTVRFTSGSGDCEAWLYEPPGRAAPGPAVVMAHGLGAVKEAGLAPYAERFAAAGYLVLVFDYRHFGGSSGEPRQLLSVRRELEDWRAAIAYTRALDGVDPDRVVAWGTSFGGGHVLSIAAEDRQLAGAIAQCPFTDGIASTLRVPPLAATRLTALALLDLAAASLGRPPRLVPTVGEPGDLAMMATPDAMPGYRALTAGIEGFDERVTARTVLDVLRYAPGRRAGRIACPLHVAICDEDSVAPAGRAAKQVARAPQAEVVHYPIGHFDIYVGEPFERAVAGYVAFLDRVVPTA
ncbi:MAG: alpha/beta fold hydrolase [Baekduia sp.]